MKKIEYDLPIFNDDDEADLNDYSTKMANAIKIQIDKFGNPLTFLGNVQTLTDLQLLTNIKNGYIYRVDDENRNYIYNGKEWVIYSDNLELVFYKYTQNITENILANQIIEIPCRYKVGDYLDVYYMGERLIKNTKTREGHYNEIGEEGSISNQIQVGWNINAGSYFDFILKENTQVEMEENEKITKLQQKNTELEKELKELNKDFKESSVQGQAEGQNIHLEDSSNCRCKISINGNSEQESREGYNLLQNTATSQTIKGVDVIVNSDKSITLNGTAIENFWLTLANNIDLFKDEYTLSLKNKISGLGLYLGSNNNTDYAVTQSTTSSEQHFILSEEMTFDLARLRIMSDTIFDNLTIYPMLKEASVTNDEYEPYGAMPSPEFPSRIRNVGDNVQLFDKDTMVTEAYVNLQSKYVTTTTGSYTIVVPVQPNTTYTISKKLGTIFRIGYVNETVTTNMDVLGVITNNNATSLSITTGANAKYLLGYVANNNDTSTTDIINSVKVEKGTRTTGPSKYGCGSADIKVQNKNLLQLETDSHGIINEDGSVTITRNVSYDVGGAAKTLTGLILKGIYTFKNISGAGAYVKFATNDYSHQIAVGAKYTFNYDGESYLRIQYPNLENGQTITYKAQLEKGTEATDYVKHEEQTIHFPLTKPLHKGDYLADDGIHYKRKTIVLDGTENFTYESAGRIFMVMHDIKDVGRIRTADILCSHFKVNTSGETKTAFHYQKLIYFFPDSSITSLTEWKVWLDEQYEAGTPVAIEYELEEEEIEEYTEEQQEAYRQLNNVRTYKTVTNISNASNAILKVDYIKDLETAVKNIVKEGE